MARLERQCQAQAKGSMAFLKRQCCLSQAPPEPLHARFKWGRMPPPTTGQAVRVMQGRLARRFRTQAAPVPVAGGSKKWAPNAGPLGALDCGFESGAERVSPFPACHARLRPMIARSAWGRRATGNVSPAMPIRSRAVPHLSRAHPSDLHLGRCDGCLRPRREGGWNER